MIAATVLDFYALSGVVVRGNATENGEAVVRTTEEILGSGAAARSGWTGLGALMRTKGLDATAGNHGLGCFVNHDRPTGCAFGEESWNKHFERGMMRKGICDMTDHAHRLVFAMLDPEPSATKHGNLFQPPVSIQLAVNIPHNVPSLKGLPGVSLSQTKVPFKKRREPLIGFFVCGIGIVLCGTRIQLKR